MSKTRKCSCRRCKVCGGYTCRDSVHSRGTAGHRGLFIFPGGPQVEVCKIGMVRGCVCPPKNSVTKPLINKLSTRLLRRLLKRKG